MDRCTVVTWNLNGLDERLLDERTEAACLAVFLREPGVVVGGPHPGERADVVLLQELVRRSWHAHWKHHLVHAGYVVAGDPVTDSEYFSAIAVRADVPLEATGVEPFPGTEMGRRMVWARAGGWWFATGHLESGRASSDERVRQLGQVVDALVREPGPAVFGGDTNLRVDEEPRVPALDRVSDAWSATGRDPNHRATWFPATPGPAGRRTGARFDRLYSNDKARCTAFALGAARVASATGEGPIDASDHLPVWARFERTAG